MKVGDLIAYLEKLDPNIEVNIFDDDSIPYRIKMVNIHNDKPENQSFSNIIIEPLQLA